jgi:hypothetical protein
MQERCSNRSIKTTLGKEFVDRCNGLKQQTATWCRASRSRSAQLVRTDCRFECRGTHLNGQQQQAVVWLRSAYRRYDCLRNTGAHCGGTTQLKRFIN